MKKFKILLFIWIILAIIGIILMFVWLEWNLSNLPSMLLSMWITMSAVSFIRKKREESEELLNDERSVKIIYKSISCSWYITLLLLCWLILIDNLWYKINNNWAFSLIFTTMLISYVISLFYYKDKKI